LWCGAKSPVPGNAVPGKPVPKAVAVSAIAAGPPPVPTGSAIAAGKPPAPSIPAAQQKPESEPAWYEQTPYGVEGPPIAALPEALAATPISAPPSQPNRQRFSEDADDDGSPYVVSEKLNYRCQECGRVLPGEAVACPSCGYNHETGTKAERTYEPVARTWEAGWPRDRRVRLFIISQIVILCLTVFGLIATRSLMLTLPGWIISAGLTAFVLGTFDRVELSRSPKGKLVLKHTWRACFIERPTQTLRLSEYEGITKGKWHDPGFWDWAGLMFLLLGPVAIVARALFGFWDWVGFVFLVPCGLVPAFFFWYYIIHSEMFFVALTKDHGHPDFTLYRGWGEKHMNDIYETIRVVAFPVETR